MTRVEDDKRIQPRTKGLGQQPILVEPQPRTPAAIVDNLSRRSILEVPHKEGTSNWRSRNQCAERDAFAVKRDHGKPAIDDALPLEDRFGAALQILDAHLDAARSCGEIRERTPVARHG